jgi:hypothetical protein
MNGPSENPAPAVKLLRGLTRTKPKRDVTGGTAPFFTPGRRPAAHQELLQNRQPDKRTS